MNLKAYNEVKRLEVKKPIDKPMAVLVEHPQVEPVPKELFDELIALRRIKINALRQTEKFLERHGIKIKSLMNLKTKGVQIPWTRIPMEPENNQTTKTAQRRTRLGATTGPRRTAATKPTPQPNSKPKLIAA